MVLSVVLLTVTAQSIVKTARQTSNREITRYAAINLVLMVMGNCHGKYSIPVTRIHDKHGDVSQVEAGRKARLCPMTHLLGCGSGG